MNTNDLIEKILESESSQNTTIEMLIELEGQRVATIIVSIHDQPQTLAKLFCYQNNLDPKVITPLANNIRNAQKSLIYQQANLNENSFNSKHQYKEQYINQSAYPPNTDHTSLLSNSTVFDRLYKDSKSRINNKYQKQQSSSKRLNHNNSTMDCSQIYDRNIKLKQKSKRKYQNMLQHKKAQQLQQCTHKPKINPISNQIASRIKHQQNHHKIIKREKQIINYIQEKQKKQLKECTFKPTLIAQDKNKSNSKINQRHVLLYEDHKLRQEKLKYITNHFIKENTQQKSFINHISNQIIKGKNFYQRLKEFQQHKKSNLQRIEKKSLSIPKSQISKSKIPKNRNKGNLNIGQYLYQKSKNKIKKHQSLQKNINNKKILHKSHEMYQDMKRIAFKYLFTLMDSDQDGLISSTKINVFNIDPEILKLISPLLCQMQQMQIQLDQDQFTQSIYQLFQTLNIDQKNKLLKVYKHQNNSYNQQSLFQPSLNQKSLEIAKKIRDSQYSLYEIWKQNRLHKQNQLNQLRQMKQIHQQQECTFHPQIHH